MSNIASESSKGEKLNLKTSFSSISIFPILLLNIFLLITIIVLFLLLISQIRFKSDDKFFAVNDNKSLFELPALSEPNLSNQTLLKWAADAAIAVYTINFNNVETRLAQVAKYFTESGYRDLLNAYERSGIIREIISKQLIVSAIPTGTPVIKNQNIYNNKYYWNIEIPILVQYQSPSNISTGNYIVNLIIQRRPTEDSASGIGIVTYSLVAG